MHTPLLRLIRRLFRRRLPEQAGPSTAELHTPSTVVPAAASSPGNRRTDPGSSRSHRPGTAPTIGAARLSNVRRRSTLESTRDLDRVAADDFPGNRRHRDDPTDPPRRRSGPRGPLLLFPWFPRTFERRFRSDYAASGHYFRIEMWVTTALAFTGLVIAEAYPFTAPDGIPQHLQLVFLTGVALPVLLCAATAPGRMLRPLSAPLFVTSKLLLVVCVTLIRAHDLRQGVVSIPLAVPIAILISPVAAQIRFPITAATILAGMTFVVGAEFYATDVDDRGLLTLTTAAMIALAVIGVSYRAEATTRSTWLLNQRLHAATRTDLLTGLPNRRRLFEAIRNAITDSPHPICLAVFDIDDFKHVNDRYGHVAGDDCLQAIGAYLLASTDPVHEFPARLAGEEFVVCWRGLTPDEARVRAELLRDGVSRVTLPTVDGASVSASAGFASATTGREDPHIAALELLTSADIALYEAKGAGRGRLVSAHRSVTRGEVLRQAKSLLPEAEPAEESETLYTGFGTLHFDEPAESAFRAAYATGDIRYRGKLMAGGAIIAVVMALAGGFVAHSTEPFDRFIGPAMWIALLPGVMIGLSGVIFRRLRPWANTLLLVGLAGTLLSQLAGRYALSDDSVGGLSFLRPALIIVSLCIMRFRYEVVAPAIIGLTAAVIALDVYVLPITDVRLTTYCACVVIIVVGLRLCYRGEYTRRIGWAHAQRLAELTRTDPLTGLPNRREFEPTLRSALSTGASTALVMIDLDHFKLYNDAFGHLSGDDCLRTVGLHLAEIAERPGTFAARLGGEEFALVLTGGSPQDYAEHAEQIRASITDLAIPGPMFGRPVTASAGVAVAHEHDGRLGPDRLTELVVEVKVRADRAMYDAKAAGRNTSHTATAGV